MIIRIIIDGGVGQRKTSKFRVGWGAMGSFRFLGLKMAFKCCFERAYLVRPASLS